MGWAEQREVVRAMSCFAILIDLARAELKNLIEARAVAAERLMVSS